MKRFREKLAQLLNQAHAAAQQNIPAGNLRDKLDVGRVPRLNLTNTDLFTGILTGVHGGTGLDGTNTGPGFLGQTTSGGAFSVAYPTLAQIDMSVGSPAAGDVLHFDGSDGVLRALDLTGAASTLSGVLSPAHGGTGVNNGSFLLTVPATGTAALLGTAQTFSENNAFSKILRARTTSGTTGYGLRIWDGTNDFGNFQALDLSSVTYAFFGTNRYYDGSAWQQFNTRVGSSFQISGDAFTFYSFAASSSTPVGRLTVQDGFVEIYEITAPAAGAANTARIFAVDNGAGKTVLKVIFSSGAAQVLATQP